MAQARQIQLSLGIAPWERGTDGKPELLPRGETIVSEEFGEAYRSLSKLSYVPLDRSWLPDVDELIGTFNACLYRGMMESLWQPFLFRMFHISLHRTMIETLLQTFIIPLQRISKSSEIEETIQRDKNLRIMLDVSVTEIIYLLQQEEEYSIHMFYERDVDVPKWKEVVISVHITERSFDDKMRLWELIEEKVRAKIEDIRKQMPKKERRKISRLNEKLSIRVKESIS
ncbi:MAG: hypothetical protein AOA66_1597 [Candidatus Bathyarchaeota archaeon BA2]|nr:MAG: hypothetical protein AOA66_1597 [Candidatus Bathyarchaeota archaeon BA2]